MRGIREEHYWSQFARSYDRDGETIVGKPILEAIEERLSNEQNLGDVVEFGCGTGHFTRAIAKCARHITATDPSDEMLEVARAKLSELQNVTIQKADCADTDFPAGNFDSVLMANLIHVIEDPVRGLQESHRILRNEGCLIVVGFTTHRMTAFRKMALGLRYVRRWGLPPHRGKSGMSPEELAQLVERVGFGIERVQLLEAGSNALYLRGVKCARRLCT